LLLLMLVAVLLFGKRLPEVGRSLGKGIVEFKKGLSGAAEEFDISGPSRSSTSYGSSWRSEDGASGDTAYSDASVPKFELPGAPSTVTSAPRTDNPPPQPRD
jgi:sec-independent protein translocase protein TatA